MILRISVIICLMLSVFCGGCNIFGFLASPSAYERKIEAEYDLRRRQAEKILVFVDEVRGGGASLDFRMDLSEEIVFLLGKKVRISKKNLIGYDEIASLRQLRGDFETLVPQHVGQALGAGVVLYLQIVDYKLYGNDIDRYYNGSLVSRCVAVDSATGEILWPDNRQVRFIHAKVELDVTREAVNERLVKATGHMMVRNFYDVPWPEYEASDEPAEYKTDWASY